MGERVVAWVVYLTVQNKVLPYCYPREAPRDISSNFKILVSKCRGGVM